MSNLTVITVVSLEGKNKVPIFSEDSNLREGNSTRLLRWPREISRPSLPELELRNVSRIGNRRETTHGLKSRKVGEDLKGTEVSVTSDVVGVVVDVVGERPGLEQPGPGTIDAPRTEDTRRAVTVYTITYEL